MSKCPSYFYSIPAHNYPHTTFLHHRATLYYCNRKIYKENPRPSAIARRKDGESFNFKAYIIHLPEHSRELGENVSHENPHVNNEKLHRAHVINT